MNIIIGNYGDATIALLQWAKQQQLPNVNVINIDTRWAAASWQQRVSAGQRLAQDYGFQTVTLSATSGFAELMQQRRDFPTAKYQWCASTLKGLAILDWLDEHDPSCEATIAVGKTRFSSRINQQLPEFIAESEYYDDRRLWHPLVHETPESFEALIKAAGFAVLGHRSLECEPCINTTNYDLAHMQAEDISKLHELEQILGKSLLGKPIKDKIAILTEQDAANNTKDYLEAFDKACSSPFGCGL